MTHANPMKMTYNTAPIIVFFGQCAYILLKILCMLGGGEEEEEGDQLVEGLESY